ncbi:MAG: hypothetical protein VB111_03560 [Clostridiaceae bacterium]|nr:hypothetical protein [Clostridiaceae bacterium]
MSLFNRKDGSPKRVSGFGEPEKFQSKYKIVAWFKNYWYYYKTPTIITACVLILAVWFIVDITSKTEDDVRLYVISDAALLEEQYTPLSAALEPYMADFNGDGQVLTGVSCLNLAENPSDEIQVYAYQQVLTIFYDQTISLMIIDDFAFEYLTQSDALAPLSEYGVSGGIDEYRIPVNNTSLFADNTISRMGEYYLVFRVCPQADADKPAVQARYQAMALFAQAMADEYQAYLVANPAD